MDAVLDFLRQMAPAPPLESCRRILCVQPHADDTDIGAGATVARLARLGAEVVYLTVTDDRLPAGTPSLRRAEQEAAARVLGVAGLRWLGYPDAGDYTEYAVRMAVIQAIREWRPDLVMTVDPHLPYESHPDHLICGRATAAAVLLYNFPHLRTDPAVDAAFTPYPIKGIALYHTAAPNTYAPVDPADWERKFEAIACHKSQIDSQTLAVYRFYFDLKARENGGHIGQERAEAFKVLAPALMHCVVDTARL